MVAASCGKQWTWLPLGFGAVALALHAVLSPHQDAPLLPAGACLDERRAAWAEPPSLRASAEFDVVVYGATGLTGGLAAHYLATRPGNFSYAIAGRSQPKLEAFSAALARLNVTRLPSASLVVAVDDLEALRVLVRRARVVVSAAGPYKLLAPLLVQACVEERTHLVTVSGEGLFIRDMIDRHHATAEHNGVKVVNAAGIVSVPFDLGAVLALQALEAELLPRGLPRERVDLKGYWTEQHVMSLPQAEPSAGAVGAYLNRQDGERRKEVAMDPYQLAPGARCTLDKSLSGRLEKGFVFDPNVGEHVAESQFGGVDGPVVRSTLELLGYRNVSFMEGATSSGKGRDGWTPEPIVSAISAYCDLGVCKSVPEAAQRQGGAKILLVAEHRGRGGGRATVRYVGREEPFYKQTAKLFVEVGLCLLDLSCHRRAVRGGVLGPAAAVDSAAFLERLRAAKTDEGEPLVAVSVSTDGWSSAV